MLRLPRKKQKPFYGSTTMNKTTMPQKTAGRAASLPSELVLEAINLSRDEHPCLIKTMGADQHCGGFQGASTAIYTRGYPDRDGVYSVGKLELLPVQHRCVHVAPVANTRVSRRFFGEPEMKSWDEQLWRGHLHRRVQVFDRNFRDEILGEVDISDSRGSGTHMAMYAPNLGMLPFRAGSFYWRLFRMEAWRYRGDDGLLDCQRIKHIMFRGPDVTPAHATIIDLMTVDDITDDDLFWYACLGLPLRQMADMLKMDWGLLDNLESLFVDFSTFRFLDNTSIDVVARVFHAMGKHLKLKLIVVKGLPMKMRFTDDYFEDLDEEALLPWNYTSDPVDPKDTAESLRANKTMDDWVRAYESQETVFFRVSFLHYIKDCLQPGGKLHMIFEAEPDTWEWPGPANYDDWIDDDIAVGGSGAAALARTRSVETFFLCFLLTLGVTTISIALQEIWTHFTTGN